MNTSTRETPSITGVRLHQLEGFYHVVRHGGFARAVEALPYPISEPALHKQVRSLEAALGASLVERGRGRRMAPTPEGRALHAFLSPYFERLPGVLRTLATGELATLHVASEPLYMTTLVSTAVARFRKTEPATKVRLLDSGGRTVIDQVLHGEADIGVASDPGSCPSGLRFEPRGRLGLSLLAPPGHPLAKRRAALTVDQLREESLILYAPGSPGRRFTEGLMSELEIDARSAAEASSSSVMQALVQAGVGAAVVPDLDGSDRPKRRTLASGVVDHDISDLIPDSIGLPRFGTFVRREIANHPLLERFRREIGPTAETEDVAS